MTRFVVVVSVAFLAAGCSTDGSGGPTSSLDEAGKNACYELFRWIEDATTLTPSETHDRIRDKIWKGSSWAGGAAEDSSSVAIHDGVRAMLEREVVGDYAGLADQAVVVADACRASLS